MAFFIKGSSVTHPTSFLVVFLDLPLKNLTLRGFKVAKNMIYLGLVVVLSVASLVVMSVTITTILQTITFFVPLPTTQFNYD